jgi:dolichol-phosphate mannosyltransferase
LTAQPARTRRWHRRPTIRFTLRSLLRPSRFGLVGVIGIGVNALALVALTELIGFHYAISAILASQVSTLHNFVLTETWVFHSRMTTSRVLVRYLAFNALNIATLFVRVPVLILLTEVGGVHYLVSNLVAIGLTFGIRYLIADNWIWAGRDHREQEAQEGWFNYDVHGLVGIRSRVALPELAAFNVIADVEPDMVVDHHAFLGGRPRLRRLVERRGDVVRYREQFGLLSAAFDVVLGDRIEVRANWLLAWSHHVLYTNMVEPLLRFLLVSRGSVLLHCASVDADRGAVLLSAKTDTGKTSTLLRLLMRQEWAFMGDDMAIIQQDGRALSYPKPMTLSSHTMSAVSDAAIPTADRIMLGIRSRVHSKSGRSVGQSLARLPVPIVTINAFLQLLIPPPKYYVNSLVDCDITHDAPIDAVILMERGDPLEQVPSMSETLDQLLLNTEDAYTFPPFAWLAPALEFDGLDVSSLRERERQILKTALGAARRFRLRVAGHEWSTLIPRILEGGDTRESTLAQTGSPGAGQSSGR